MFLKSGQKRGQYRSRYQSSRGKFNGRNESYTSKDATNNNFSQLNNTYSPLNDTLSEEEKEKMVKRAERFNKPSNSKLEYGLISRGEDTRLRESSEEREMFFDTILNTFVKYCNSNTTSSLNKNLSRIISSNIHPRTYDQMPLVNQNNDQDQSDATIEHILMSLRKLREALISQKPDHFTVKVFLFSIRITSMMGHYQSYIPAISYLLRKEPYSLLSREESIEIVTLLTLHISHYNRENSRALQYYYKYLHQFEQTKTLEILKSWINKDYYNWVRFYNAESDSSRAFIMGFGTSAIVEHMVFCMTKSYFTMEISDLEHILPNGVTYTHLLEKYNAPWKKIGNMVIIRDRRR